MRMPKMVTIVKSKIDRDKDLNTIGVMISKKGEKRKITEKGVAQREILMVQEVEGKNPESHLQLSKDMIMIFRIQLVNQQISHLKIIGMHKLPRFLQGSEFFLHELSFLELAPTKQNLVPR